MIAIAIGLLAQLFFSARVLVQWVMSERARRVLSPSAFWVLSLAGSWLLCVYGWMRQDFAIVVGQLVAYYVYIWNLQAKGVLGRWPAAVRWLLLLTPPAALAVGMRDIDSFVAAFFQNADLPLWLIRFGTAGQLIFTLRFVYQWWYSSRLGRSELPRGFWILSIVGSSLVFIYGCLRSDIVLILGQSFGMVAYVRNLIIGIRASRRLAPEPDGAADVAEAEPTNQASPR